MKQTTLNPLNLAFATLLMAGSASAASIVLDTKGTINTNARTIIEATGNSQTWTDFNASVGTAFANGTGGVADLTVGTDEVRTDETITLNYGVSNTLVMTMTAGDRFKVEENVDEATSGAFVFAYGNRGQDTRTFTLNTPLLELGIFNTDRAGGDRAPRLIVDYQDGTSASTSDARADGWYFHSLSGTTTNPIVGFSLDQSDFVRWDDLAFIAVPEPSTALLGGLGLLALLRRRR